MDILKVLNGKWFQRFSVAAVVLLILAETFVPVLTQPKRAEAANAPLVLQAGGEGAVGWNIPNIAPGSSGSKTITLTNAGANTGYVSVWITDIIDTPWTNPKFNDPAAPGHLSNYLTLTPVSTALTTNLTFPLPLGQFPQSAIGANYVLLTPLATNQSVDLHWNWSLPQATGNDAQGNSVSFVIHYLLQTPTLVSIAVTPLNPLLTVGATQQFTATGTFSDHSTADITNQVIWSSSTATIAGISASGLATALALGTTTITATLNGISGSTSLTVSTSTLTGLLVTPINPSLAVGNTLPFTATDKYADGTTIDRTNQAVWTSSDVTKATIVANTGIATAVATGPTTITATFGGRSGSTVLTVMPPVVRTLAITPASPSVPAGLTIPLHLTGTFTNNTTADLTTDPGTVWASLNLSIATISATGVVTGVTPGTVTITATNGGQTASVTVTVTAPTLVSIAVTPAAATAGVGGTVQYTATGTYSDGSTANITSTVTWTSSTPSVATISGIGLATGLASGPTSITASLGTVTSTASILTVKAGLTLTSITVTPANPSIAAGAKQQFVATGTFSDGSTADITTQVTWSSSATNVASIGVATGQATGIIAGTSTITASKGSVSGSTVLTVTPPVLTSISVTPVGVSVAAGRTQQYTATGTYSDGSTADITNTVTWSVSDITKATIAASGLATSKSVGTVNIIAAKSGISSQPDPTKPTAILTITDKVLTSITITPSSVSVPAGGQPVFTATGTYSDGSTANISNSVNWVSINGSIASIDASGKATSYTAGTTTITATQDAINSAPATLNVTNKTLLSIAIDPLTPTIIGLAHTLPFRAVGTYSDQTIADITSIVAWTSGTPVIATISTAGVATSVAAGTSTIQASLAGRTASTILTVTDRTLVSLAVTPGAASVAAGRTQQFTATGTFNDGSTKDLTGEVTWTSATPSVAKIFSANGLATGLTVGTSLVSATLGGVLSPSATLTVTAPVVDSITVTPSNSSILYLWGAPPTQQFAATANYSDGSAVVVTNLSAWSSSVPAIASINAATGLAATPAAPPVAGTTVITATYGGKSGTTNFTVVVNGVWPRVTMTYPMDGVLTLTSNNVTFAGYVDDIYAATVLIVNGTVYPLTLDGSGNFTRGALLLTGNNNIEVVATDPSGDTGSTGTFSVIINPVKPTITITSPVNGSLTNNPAQTINGTVSGVPAATISLAVNGVTQTVNVASGKFSVPATFAEGENILSATGYATGHEGDESYRGSAGITSVILDSVAPVVKVISPVAGSTVSTPSVTFTGTVDDPTVGTVKVNVAGGASTTTPVVNGVFSLPVALAAGANSVTVTATDKAGNGGSSGAVTVNFRSASPVVKITTPANALVTNAATQIVAGSVDNVSIPTATVLVNGVSTTVPVSGGIFSAIVQLKNGSNSIEVRDSDSSTPPNTGTSGMVAVTVDNVPPYLSISLTDPTDVTVITITSDKTLAAPPVVNVGATSIFMHAIAVNQWAGTYGSSGSPMAYGNYTVIATGTDLAGNTSTQSATFTKTKITTDGNQATIVTDAGTTLHVLTNGAVVNSEDFSLTQTAANPSGNVRNPTGSFTTAGVFVEIVASVQVRGSLKTIEIRVKYNPADLAPGTDESQLRLYLWDVTTGTWQMVPGSTVNTVTKEIIGTTTHLSTYGGFVAPPSPPAAPAPRPNQPGQPPIVIPTPPPQVIVPPTPIPQSKALLVTDPSIIESVPVSSQGATAQAATISLMQNRVTVTMDRNTYVISTDNQLPDKLAVTQSASQPPLPADLTLVSPVYDLTGYLGDKALSSVQFDPPLRLVVSYDQSLVPVNVASLFLAYYDKAQGWVSLGPPEGFIAAEGQVAAVVSHFTPFAVFATLKPLPARFLVHDLKLSASQVKPGDNITITVQVTNQGGLSGEYAINASIQDLLQTKRIVNLGPGKSKQISFTITASQPGTYLVQIGGLKEYFTVGAAGGTSGVTLFLNSRVWIILDILALILIAILVSSRDHDPEKKRKTG